MSNAQLRVIPAMTIDDARKVLKTKPCSTWESIEQTRRQLVQLSHPERLASMNAAMREHARQEARRVNAAYAVLSHLRTGMT
jgi:DnaJ-domain-containing protein 1